MKVSSVRTDTSRSRILMHFLFGGAVFAVAFMLLPRDSESAEETKTPTAINRLFAPIFPGARIEVEGPGVQETLNACSAGGAQVVSEGPQGYFRVRCGNQFDQVVRVRAFAKARLALQRIAAGTPLSQDQFRELELDVSFGQFRPYRESLASTATENLSGFQSAQTIVEGTPLLTTAMRKTPDLRRGDGVRLQVRTGDIQLSLQAIAAEDGTVGEKIRVYTEKSRRELVGKLTRPGWVEVAL